MKKQLHPIILSRILLLTIALFCCFTSFAAQLPVSEASRNITINFSEIKIRDLLQLICKQSGKNVIISDKIVGTTSIHLNNVSSTAMLNLILRMHGLTKSEDDALIYIAPAKDLAVEEQLARSYSPVITAIALRYANADAVAELLSKSSGLLATSESIVPDKRTNTLLLQVSTSKLPAIKDFVRQVDLPLKQILIMAKIVSVDENFMHEFGLKLGATKSSRATAKDTGNNNELPLETFDMGHFNLTISKLADAALLSMELAALENSGRGKVISSPKLLTADRREALIESGSEIPYQEKASRGGTSVAFKKATLSLKVTPEIVGTREINLHLALNQDKIGQVLVNGVPTIDTHKIQTQVSVTNGQTVVLGGIYETLKINRTTALPVLGRVPILGGLFRDQENHAERRELLIFVTPKIVTPAVLQTN